MKHTDRYAMVRCPQCDGEGGEMSESYAGYDSFNGPAIREEWTPCETCEGQGKVQRVDRLAWLIGEARREDAALAGLRLADPAERGHWWICRWCGWEGNEAAFNLGGSLTPYCPECLATANVHPSVTGGNA